MARVNSLAIFVSKNSKLQSLMSPLMSPIDKKGEKVENYPP
jgi:hypothetical protein